MRLASPSSRRFPLVRGGRQRCHGEGAGARDAVRRRRRGGRGVGDGRDLRQALQDRPGEGGGRQDGRHRSDAVRAEARRRLALGGDAVGPPRPLRPGDGEAARLDPRRRDDVRPDLRPALDLGDEPQRGDRPADRPRQQGAEDGQVPGRRRAGGDRLRLGCAVGRRRPRQLGLPARPEDLPPHAGPLRRACRLLDRDERQGRLGLEHDRRLGLADRRRHPQARLDRPRRHGPGEPRGGRRRRLGARRLRQRGRPDRRRRPAR